MIIVTYLSSIVCLTLFLFFASLIALAVWAVRNFFSAPVLSEAGFRNIWVNFLTASLCLLAASNFLRSFPRCAWRLFLRLGASTKSSGISTTSTSVSSSLSSWYFSFLLGDDSVFLGLPRLPENKQILDYDQLSRRAWYKWHIQTINDNQQLLCTFCFRLRWRFETICFVLSRFYCVFTFIIICFFLNRAFISIVVVFTCLLITF